MTVHGLPAVLIVFMIMAVCRLPAGVSKPFLCSIAICPDSTKWGGKTFCNVVCNAIKVWWGLTVLCSVGREYSYGRAGSAWWIQNDDTVAALAKFPPLKSYSLV